MLEKSLYNATSRSIRYTGLEAISQEEEYYMLTICDIDPSANDGYIVPSIAPNIVHFEVSAVHKKSTICEQPSRQTRETCYKEGKHLQ